MKWVAIIRVRSPLDCREAAIQVMQTCLHDLRAARDLQSLRLDAACYRHQTIETDATLALFFDEPEVSDRATNLVNRICALLQDVGQVDTSRWIDVSPDQESKETE